MRNLAFIIVMIFATFGVSGQTLEKPSEGKAMVYIIRTGDLIGVGMNFRVYDGEKFLGALPTDTYFTYECDPGKHLFWVTTENRSFVEATLEAGKTYVINLKAKTGVTIPEVSALPMSPNNDKDIKILQRVLGKHLNVSVVGNDKSKEKQDNVEKAMKAYNSIKDKEKSKIRKLTSDMNFKN